MTESAIQDGSPTAADRSTGGTILEIKGLKKYFDTSDSLLDKALGTTTNSVKAVDDVTFDVPKGKTIGIVGESGCGKSTLGRTILGLHPATDGQVLFEGQDITSMDRQELKEFRKQSHIIFQDPFASLNPRMTISAIIREPLDIHEIGKPAERRERVMELLERVGLSKDQLNRYPHEFSGGQRQRISIARALAIEPKLIVLDEPVSSLDVSVQSQILNLLIDLQQDLDLTYLFIAHDLSVVRFISDIVGIMYLGKLVEMGPTEAIFEDPSHPYTRALLENIPRPSPEEYHREVNPLKGNVPSPRLPPSGCRFRTRCPSLIPPSDYVFDQDEWRAFADFRDRVVAPDGQELLDSLVDEDDTPNDLDAKIRERWEIPQPLGDAKAEEAFTEAVRSMVAGEYDWVQSMMQDEFRSPCEKRVPPFIETGESETACLLYE